ncbi:MAG: tetratricopeptide repeat protein [Chloroflexi bacterium]|nr:tetratricopeptide repeat protein [Chloroflexota bacterium]MCC6894167.1 tetratricopeptide repeat protein [Anaerolineae bacterium]
MVGVLIVIFVMTSGVNDPSLPVGIGLIGLMIATVIAANRFPRFKNILRVSYNLLYPIIAVFGPLLVLMLSLLGIFPLDVFMVIFLFLLIVIFVWPPIFVMYTGQLSANLGKPGVGVRFYSYFMKLSPNSGILYAQRAVLNQNLKAHDVALNDYDTALKLAKTKPVQPQPALWSFTYSLTNIYANKADIYLQKHDPQQALFECNSGLAVKENQPAVKSMLYLRRGHAQLLMGNYQGALADLDSLRLEDKITPELLALKALAYQALNRHAEAQIAWQQAITLNPEYTNPAWLRDTLKWPEPLLTLASALQTAAPTKTDTKV